MQSIPTHRPRAAVLTIAEVMDVLRIGRTKAYEQARLYLDTNGEDGLPCIKVGDSIRFLRHAIEDLIGEPITHHTHRPPRHRPTPHHHQHQHEPTEHTPPPTPTPNSSPPNPPPPP